MIRKRAERLDTQLRKRQIAQAALEIMSADGLKALSIAAVARRVGLAPSAIYRHYQGKDEVLDAALDFIRETFLGNAAASRAVSDDPLERLRDLVGRHLAFFMRNRALPRIIFSDETVASVPRRRARVYRMVCAYLREIAEIVREGQRSGTLTSRIDPGTAALLFLGMIQPAGFLRLLSGGEVDVAAHLRRVWPLYEAILQGAACPRRGRVGARRSAQHAS